MSKNTFWSPELLEPNTPSAASTATEQDALAWNKYQPQQQSFPIDSDHSLTWDGVRGDIYQTPLITNILQRHM